jgi:hypothetical protein
MVATTEEKRQKSFLTNMVFFTGLVFLFIGIVGMVVPGLFKMHLSFTHNIIYLLTAFIAFFVSLTNASDKCRAYTIYMGSFYGVLGVLGFLIGQPGYPSVGNLSQDQHLLKVIPNVLEFGRSDHYFHLLISAFLIFMRLTSRKQSAFEV